MENKNITFGEMFDWMQNADRDETGHVYYDDMPGMALHIYTDNRQCNIECRNNLFAGDYAPTHAMIFDPDDRIVKVYKCNSNGCTDYSHPSFTKNFNDMVGSAIYGLDAFINGRNKPTESKHLYAIISAPDEPFELLKDKKLNLKIGKQNNILKISSEDSGNIIWETSIVQNIERTKIGVTITTKNSTYNFLQIDTISVEILEKEYKPIHYGNGYSKYVFKFNRILSQKEFEAWLRVNHYLVKYDHAWYEDYCKIQQRDIGDEWEYTHILAYTD